MPPKKNTLGRKSPAALRKQLQRQKETEEQTSLRLQDQKERSAHLRENESQLQREERLEYDRNRHAQGRLLETPQKQSERLQSMRTRAAQRREDESAVQQSVRLQTERSRAAERRENEAPEQKSERLHSMKTRAIARRENESVEARNQRHQQDQARIANHRNQKVKDWNLMAFNYDPTHNYANEHFVKIGGMTVKCKVCGALKWDRESEGICCSKGKIRINLLKEPPEPLKGLLIGETPESKHFLRNIRKYNCAFQMCSFGANIHDEGGFMPTFKINGQIHHRIGSLLPLQEDSHQFLQIYFVGDMTQEAQRRCNVIDGDHQTKRRCNPNDELKFDLVLKLQEMLHTKNNYVRSFISALDNAPNLELKLVINADKRPSGEHSRRFNQPECNEVAVIISGEEHGKRDIILHGKDNQLQRINETHRSYDALQYPLLNVTGEDGYHFGIPQYGTNKAVSCMDFYKFHSMIRPNQFNHLHRSKALFHQYLVDMYAKIEAERLLYIRTHQKELRADSYIHLRDSINNDASGSELGQLIILPSSHTFSPRYMHEKAQDAMTYVKKYGRPDFFITFTCNPRWREIKDELLPGQNPMDRPDLIARVFHLKNLKLMELITKAKIFGDVRCWLYTIEFQKRGLPHSHILIWLVNKIHTNEIDLLISAELPDPREDKELYDIVKSHMVHGPCGALNRTSPCMDQEKKICTKKYPRKFVNDTQLSEDGYPSYRRRNPDSGGFDAIIGHHEIDNRWIVPYSPLLLKTFDGHINVEYCNSIKSIKYVCKYVHKGSDAAMYALQQQNSRDEIEMYTAGRYISSIEACWRIFGFLMHDHYPTVVHLSVHLENGQRVYFTPATAAQQIEAQKDTTLTAFFKLCQHDPFAKLLYYHQVPSYYTWDNKAWKRRKRGTPVEGHPEIKFDSALGRVYTIHPSQHECFFLRMLLFEVKGPTSFNDLRTVNGIVYPTYREACLQRGLLEDDAQWDATLSEASVSTSPSGLRTLFAMLLNACNVSDPVRLWTKYKDDLTEDYHYQMQLQFPEIEITYNDQIYNKSLIDIENKVLTMGGNELQIYGLPKPIRNNESGLSREMLRETSYDIEALTRFINENEPKLLPEQNRVYVEILDSVQKNHGGIFFLDAPGGTGKTFVTKLVLAKARQKGRIALAVASSGIAATLLPNGRTAHSTFKLPIDLSSNENPFCNITKSSNIAQVLKKCSLIIWDECTMAHKKALEAVDRTLKDIRENDLPMGGITLVLSGDFRQTLPVIPKGTKADEIKACLKSSRLWRNVKNLKLQTNMREYLQRDRLSKQFAEDLLALGGGTAPLDNDGLLDPSRISTIVKTETDLICNVFPNLQENFKSEKWLCERAILAPQNSTVNSINSQLINSLEGGTMNYKSIDTVIDPNEAVNYPVEFLNSLEMSGLPSHKLELKIGAPIMLLRNLDPPRLCNGTRFVIKKMMPHVIEAIILSGCAAGESVFIPRIPISPTDSVIQFKRLQFPIKLCFAMTINKSQGQTLKVAGLHLKEHCFSHGQLYVGCSRVGIKSNLFIYVPQGKTKNIVYREVL